MPRPPVVAALIVAAGRGSRFGGPLPKQYTDLDGHPLLRRTLAAFVSHPALSAVRTVIHPADHALYDAAADGLNCLPPIDGGKERQDSVRLGLQSLQAVAPDIVLIHDGARPFISHDVIDRVLAAFDDDAVTGVIPGIAVSDTLKRVDDGTITATVPRQGLWRAQTPQAFRFAPILAAHTAHQGEALTDDAAVAEAEGLRVVMVEGERDNTKVTVSADLQTSRSAPASAALPVTPCVGSGFDVHSFDAGDHVTICGISIPHTHKLSGHSDADVALHALTDALYGAIGAGDIGHHFPPSDSRWKGCDSMVFLHHARDLIRALGGQIVHVDLTIICEAPKMGPFRSAMVRCLAKALDLSSARVSVKATTTEKLGFTGRREGIAAQATATVMMPAR